MSSVVSDFVHRIGQDLTSLLLAETGGNDGLTLTQIRILDCVERNPGTTQARVCIQVLKRLIRFYIWIGYKRYLMKGLFVIYCGRILMNEHLDGFCPAEGQATVLVKT